MSKSIHRIGRTERYEDENVGAIIQRTETTQPDLVHWEVEIHHMQAVATTAIVNGTSPSWERAITDATETARLLRTIFPKP